MAVKDRMTQRAYSYRDDLAVPAFPDQTPIIIFDGYCALCSGWVAFVLRHDSRRRYRLMTAQSPTGQAIYKHYQLDPEDYETNILLMDGFAWFKSEGSLRMIEGLGFPWNLARILRVLPVFLRDHIYELVARNRFQWFGRNKACYKSSEDTKNRFLN